MKTNVKAGWKTSEFWATMITVMIITAAEMSGHSLSEATVAGIVAPVIAFAMSRFGVKKNAEQ